MAQQQSEGTSTATWFVGASLGGTEDQLPRFLAEGIWENGYKHRHLDLVRSMRSGERIAIKSSYTRKRDLPFDNRGHPVSVMAIKAVGTITENLNDGRRVRVNWIKLDPTREWYFYTHRGTIWSVTPGKWQRDALIAFAFDNKSQDIDRFLSEPYWRERYGTSSDTRFGWTDFYISVADKLLNYRNDRSALVKGIEAISTRVKGLGHLTDNYASGGEGFVKDICPFTTMGLFNRWLKPANRVKIAGELAKFIGVHEAVPESFEGVPLLFNLNSWFFPYETERDGNHIDALWAVFAAGIKFADSDADDSRARAEFTKAFDNANGRNRVAWNLTVGLYWARPWDFLSLDRNSQVYITEKLRIPIERHGPRELCNAADYLALMETLQPRFQEANYSVHSYPELSLAAWQYKPTTETDDEPGDGEVDEPPKDPGAEPPDNDPDPPPTAKPRIPYSVSNVIEEGCFLDRGRIDWLRNQLERKKNLILQGPPGTGKTWLSKRLAFTLVGHKDESKIRAVQFHPNLSYEDFVRGWRPTGDGKLSLVNGIFMEAIEAALKDPSPFVVVIEEINRGNPAQIFGELLTLLEADKRTPDAALNLCHADFDGRHRPIYIPGNLYVIGTMNIADRSLALVDFALRRRFAFVELEPKLGALWRNWVVATCGVDGVLAADIERRIEALNVQIAGDSRLGRQFRIGHSFVTPSERLEAGKTRDWFEQVVETEIRPLLNEYWFDSEGDARQACERLLQGW